MKEIELYVTARRNYKTLLRKKKQTFKFLAAQSLANNLNNPKEFWKEVKKSCNIKKKNSVSNQITSEQWLNHFRKLFTPSSENRGENLNFAELETSVDSLDNPITIDEVKNSLNRLKNKKSGGLDGVAPEMLKVNDNGVLSYLTDLFNEIFASGEYPDAWSEAIIVPIFKGGDNNNVDNYRGISLLSVLGKCYTSILNRRLYTWLEENNKIHNSQAGFRSGFSTSDHAFTLYAATQKYLTKSGSKLYVAFIDLKKAFDNVTHRTLLDSLYNAGVSSKFIQAIKAIYNRVKSCVRVEDDVTAMFDCPQGLRQGCVLSPTLFTIIINKVALRVNEMGRHGVQLVPGLLELLILLFADDIALISCTASGLQTQLDILFELCKELSLIINTEKSKIIVFRHGGYLGKHEKWLMNGNPIEVVNSYVYLGYKFTTTMSSIEAAKYLAFKGKKAVYNIFQAHAQLQPMSHKTFFKIFDSVVQPVLSYMAEIWGLLIDPDKDPTEKIHLLACKRLLNVTLRTPNKMVYGELGRYPLSINYKIKAVKFWLRLLKLNLDRLPRQAYQLLVSLDEKGKSNWITKLKMLLFQTGFGVAWINQGVGNEKSFILALKQRLLDMYAQGWNSVINDSPRYAIYKLFKQAITCETYLNCITIKSFRDSMTRFRLGISTLKTHKNRYTRDNRIGINCCPFCPDVVDDELHLLFNCSAYDNLRPQFLCNIRPTNQTVQFINILSTEDCAKIKQLSWYLFKCFQKHDEHNDAEEFI